MIDLTAAALVASEGARLRCSSGVQFGETLHPYGQGVHDALSSTNGVAIDVDMEIDMDVARLREEIRAAEERLAAARRRADDRRTELNATLAAELSRVRAVISDMDLEHQAALDALRIDTAAAVARIARSESS